MRLSTIVTAAIVLAGIPASLAAEGRYGPMSQAQHEAGCIVRPDSTPPGKGITHPPVVQCPATAYVAASWDHKQVAATPEKVERD